MTPPATVQRETLRVAVMAVRSATGTLLGWLHGLLAARDERRQTVDLAWRIARARWTRLLRLLRLRLREGLTLARKIGLRLARAEWRFASRGLPIVVALVKAVVPAALLRVVLGASEVRIVLPKLLLCGCDDPVIVLGVLVVVFSCNRVAGCLRVARELDVFLGDVRRITANFHVGPVRTRIRAPSNCGSCDGCFARASACSDRFS